MENRGLASARAQIRDECDWHVRYTQYLVRLIDRGTETGATTEELEAAEFVRQWRDLIWDTAEALLWV